VVRDQVLRLANQAGQLVHHAIAPGELGQEPPTQGMPGKLQELRRGDISVNLLRTHSQPFTSTSLDMSISIGVFGMERHQAPNSRCEVRLHHTS
jgi:hypothetical protein